MKDRRPGTYYFPNEGLRYWDGEEWSESEPRPDNPEGSNLTLIRPTGVEAARGCDLRCCA